MRCFEIEGVDERFEVIREEVLKTESSYTTTLKFNPLLTTACIKIHLYL